MKLQVDLPKQEYLALGAEGVPESCTENFMSKTRSGEVDSTKALSEAIEKAMLSEHRGLVSVSRSGAKPGDIPYQPGETEEIKPKDGDEEMGPSARIEKQVVDEKEGL